MKNHDLAEHLADHIERFALTELSLTDSEKSAVIGTIYKALQDKQPDPLPKFWILEVGDEPGDETVQGPFDEFPSAELAKHSFYTWRLPEREGNHLYWGSQISGLYLVHDVEKPDYMRDFSYEGLKAKKAKS